MVSGIRWLRQAFAAVNLLDGNVTSILLGSTKRHTTFSSSVSFPLGEVAGGRHRHLRIATYDVSLQSDSF